MKRHNGGLVTTKAGGPSVETEFEAGETTKGSTERWADPRRCDIVLALLARKWMIPILMELARSPQRRQYLFVTLRVSSSRLDPTIQTMKQWGLIELTWIPSGKTDGPGLGITDLGRSLLTALTTLSEWQNTNETELLANSREWIETHQEHSG